MHQTKRCAICEKPLLFDIGLVLAEEVLCGRCDLIQLAKRREEQRTATLTLRPRSESGMDSAISYCRCANLDYVITDERDVRVWGVSNIDRQTLSLYGNILP